ASTAVAADGSTVVTVSDWNTNGSLRDQAVTTTSANGLSVRIDRDTTRSGTLHLAQTDGTVLNLDGSRRRTIVDLNASGTTRDRTVVTTSANGLSSRTEWDARATGTFNRVQTVAIALGQDGSRTEVVSNLNASDVLRDRTTTTTSGDRN